MYFVIFDDNCPICIKGVELLDRLDKMGLVELVPLSQATLPDGRPLPSKKALAEQMHVISSDGQVWRGAEAVTKLTSLFPQSQFVATFLRLPLIRSAAKFVYARVAANRLALVGTVSKKKEPAPSAGSQN